MKTHFRLALLLALLYAAAPAQAALRVLATVPEWGALATELGGDKLDVYTATNAFQDPHRIEAKPSLVARARSADLLFATGAQLEIGWLPVLQQESGNARIQTGAPGYFEATSVLHLLEVPRSVDRSLGDMHPFGNPHVQLDPHNIATVATALSERLAMLDPGNAEYYRERARNFLARWQSAIARWEQQAAPLKGVPIVVMHQDQVYLCNWLGLQRIAAIEPKPGVPPSAGYLAELVEKLSASPPRMILRNAYNDPRSADWLGKRINTPVVLLPFTVGGTPGAKDLFGLFDDTISRLLAALR